MTDLGSAGSLLASFARCGASGDIGCGCLKDKFEKANKEHDLTKKAELLKSATIDLINSLEQSRFELHSLFKGDAANQALQQFIQAALDQLPQLIPNSDLIDRLMAIKKDAPPPTTKPVPIVDHQTFKPSEPILPNNGPIITHERPTSSPPRPVFQPPTLHPLPDTTLRPPLPPKPTENTAPNHLPKSLHPMPQPHPEPKTQFPEATPKPTHQNPVNDASKPISQIPKVQESVTRTISLSQAVETHLTSLQLPTKDTPFTPQQFPGRIQAPLLQNIAPKIVEYTPPSLTVSAATPKSDILQPVVSQSQIKGSFPQQSTLQVVETPRQQPVSQQAQPAKSIPIISSNTTPVVSVSSATLSVKNTETVSNISKPTGQSTPTPSSQSSPPSTQTLTSTPPPQSLQNNAAPTLSPNTPNPQTPSSATQPTTTQRPPAIPEPVIQTIAKEPNKAVPIIQYLVRETLQTQPQQLAPIVTQLTQAIAKDHPIRLPEITKTIVAAIPETQPQTRNEALTAIIKTIAKLEPEALPKVMTTVLQEIPSTPTPQSPRQQDTPVITAPIAKQAPTPTASFQTVQSLPVTIARVIAETSPAQLPKIIETIAKTTPEPRTIQSAMKEAVSVLIKEQIPDTPKLMAQVITRVASSTPTLLPSVTFQLSETVRAVVSPDKKAASVLSETAKQVQDQSTTTASKPSSINSSAQSTQSLSSAAAPTPAASTATVQPQTINGIVYMPVQLNTAAPIAKAQVAQRPTHAQSMSQLGDTRSTIPTLVKDILAKVDPSLATSVKEALKAIFSKLDPVTFSQLLNALSGLDGKGLVQVIAVLNQAMGSLSLESRQSLVRLIVQLSADPAMLKALTTELNQLMSTGKLNDQTLKQVLGKFETMAAESHAFKASHSKTTFSVSEGLASAMAASEEEKRIKFAGTNIQQMRAALIKKDQFTTLIMNLFGKSFAWEDGELQDTTGGLSDWHERLHRAKEEVVF